MKHNLSTITDFDLTSIFESLGGSCWFNNKYIAIAVCDNKPWALNFKYDKEIQCQ